MLTVRLRPKHQITLPASIVNMAGIHEDDILEAECINGVISLIPKRNVGEKDDLMSYAGIARKSYGSSPQEIETTLSEIRKEWER